LEFIGIYLNLLEFIGIYWNLLEFSRVYLEFIGILLDFLGLLIFLGFFGMYSTKITAYISHQNFLFWKFGHMT
jgi:hypothetical protein